jgi:error-prone DNA polymerase
MSEEAISSILSARKRGEFTSLRDFITRTEVNRRITEHLVEVGTFDSFADRYELLAEIPKLMKARITNGMQPLFIYEPPVASEVSMVCEDRMSRMYTEHEMLSLNLSAHPMDFVNSNKIFTKMKDLKSIRTGESIVIAGSVIRYQTPPTRNGKRVMYVIMEDGTGIADVTVFGDVQEKCGQILFREGWLSVKGKIQRRGPKALSIIAEKLEPLILYQDNISMI